MGYYTNYDVTVSNLKDEKDAVYFEHKLNEIVGYHFENQNLFSQSDGTYTFEFFIGEAKWYDHNDNLIDLSELFPDVLIEVNGEGEESGDIWKARYKNGKSERIEAVLTFPDFKEILE